MNLFTPLKQNDVDATFCGKIKKSDGIIILKDFSSEQIYNLYRAYKEYPKVAISHPVGNFGEGVKIIECEMSSQLYNPEKECNNLVFQRDTYYLKCKNNSLLKITKLMNQQGKLISLSGYKL